MILAGTIAKRDQLSPEGDSLAQQCRQRAKLLSPNNRTQKETRESKKNNEINNSKIIDKRPPTTALYQYTRHPPGEASSLSL